MGNANPIFDKTKYKKSGLLGWRWEFARSVLFGSANMNWITSELYYDVCIVDHLFHCFGLKSYFVNVKPWWTRRKGIRAVRGKSRSNCWIVIHCSSHTWKGDSPKCYFDTFYPITMQLVLSMLQASSLTFTQTGTKLERDSRIIVKNASFCDCVYVIAI